MVLLIDNYDSFTWNLVHRLAEVEPSLAPGGSLRVVRNDEVRAEDIGTIDRGKPPGAIVISPGPCSPAESGVACEAVRRFAGRVPMLGVCLGHQCIAAAFGMRVARAPSPVHGKRSRIAHTSRGVFASLPSPLTAMRYHSLAVDEATIPPGWEMTARTAEGPPVVMGLRRTWEKAPLEGVQFHPESFATPHGHAMLRTFLRDAGVLGAGHG